MRWGGGAALVAALLGVAACGDDDGSLAPGAGGDASAGEGPGGKAGSGTAGTGALAGAPGGGAGADSGGAGPGGASGGGGAGAAGEGGSGFGAAGAGGDGPSYGEGTDCNGDAFQVDQQLAKRCVLLASCAGPYFSPFSDNRAGDLSTSECIAHGPVLTAFSFYTNVTSERPFEFDARASACPVSIDSCDEVLACAGYRNPIHECDEDASARCDGELAINCGERPVVIDCARTTGEGGTCKVASGRAICDTGQQCQTASSPPACEGDTLYSCDGGVSNGTDCAAFGLVCHEFQGYAACVTPLPVTTCSELDEPGCDGSKRTYCSPSGLRFEHECKGAAPLTCVEDFGEQVNDRSFLDCLPKGCVFPYYDLRVDECQGDDLRLGIQGDVSLHCPDYGFSTCRNGVCAN